MELYRKTYDQLVQWKNDAGGKSAVMIEGARRVGKSTIAEKFARENYKSYILIDFRTASKTVKDNFIDNMSPKRLDIFFQLISVEYGVRLYKRESLIIFDEVQMFPKAREAIKDLVKDGRYDYIETGSLISIRENVRDIVIPSEERVIKMYPLDFEEFMLAHGESMLYEHIGECYLSGMPLNNSFHKRAMLLFNEFMLVGGMPQSVTAYLENECSFHESSIRKRDILTLYANDIRKADVKYGMRISRVFDNIPGFLSKHDKKIVLSDIDSNKQFSQYADALFWLDDSMICSLCYRSSDPKAGLSVAKDDSSVKCYMGDTGLLVSMVLPERGKGEDEMYKSVLTGKMSLNKGMLFENMVAQVIRSQSRELYFYTHYSETMHNNDIEIDFLLPGSDFKKHNIVPFEVKSSKNYTTISFDRFRKHFAGSIGTGFVVHPKQFKTEGDVVFIPPYMLPFAVVGL